MAYAKKFLTVLTNYINGGRIHVILRLLVCMMWDKVDY